MKREGGIKEAFEARPATPEVPPTLLEDSSDHEEGNNGENDILDEESEGHQAREHSRKRKRELENAGLNSDEGDHDSGSEVEDGSEEETARAHKGRRTRTGTSSFGIAIANPSQQMEADGSSEEETATPVHESVRAQSKGPRPRAGASAAAERVKPSLKLDTSMSRSDSLSSEEVIPREEESMDVVNAEAQDFEEGLDEVPITSSSVVSSSPASRYEEVPPLPMEEQLTSSAIRKVCKLSCKCQKYSDRSSTARRCVPPASGGKEEEKQETEDAA